jgi:hypothetical protein
MSMSFTISNPDSPCDKSALTVTDAETNAVNDVTVPLSILGNDTAEIVTGELVDGVSETRLIKDTSGGGDLRMMTVALSCLRVDVFGNDVSLAISQGILTVVIEETVSRDTLPYLLVTGSHMSVYLIKTSCCVTVRQLLGCSCLRRSSRPSNGSGQGHSLTQVVLYQCHC